MTNYGDRYCTNTVHMSFYMGYPLSSS